MKRLFLLLILLSHPVSARFCDLFLGPKSDSWIHQKITPRNPFVFLISPDSFLTRADLKTPAEVFISFNNSHVLNELLKFNSNFLRDGIYPEVKDLNQWAHRIYEKKMIPKELRIYPGKIHFNSLENTRITHSYFSIPSNSQLKGFEDETDKIMSALSYIFSLSKNILPIVKDNGLASPTNIPRYHHELSHLIPLVLDDDYRESILEITKFSLKKVSLGSDSYTIYEFLNKHIETESKIETQEETAWISQKREQTRSIYQRIEAAWKLKEEGHSFFISQYNKFQTREDLKSSWQGSLFKIKKDFKKVIKKLRKNYIPLGGTLSDMLALRHGMGGSVELDLIFTNKLCAEIIFQQNKSKGFFFHYQDSNEEYQKLIVYYLQILETLYKKTQKTQLDESREVISDIVNLIEKAPKTFNLGKVQW